MRLPERALPTRLGALVFQLKTNLFRARRSLIEMGRGPRRLARGKPVEFPIVAAQLRSALWSDPRPSERALQWGKVQNLRAAARLLDKTVLPAGEVFSFWRQMGPARATRGFVAGRMLQEGCLVPATGGGLCQLSNALYAVALDAGCTIIERHAHSRLVPGARGRDATVAWNYVDLRFTAPADMMLRVIVQRDELVVSLHAPPTVRGVGPHISPPPQGDIQQDANSCGSCGEASCFRHEGARPAPVGRTAYLVDENWPEFRAYVAGKRTANDVLALPRRDQRSARYAWPMDGFARIETATLATLTRSVRLRLAKDGPQKRSAELASAEALARRHARALKPDVMDVVVAQSLLPYLWRDGHLSGRRFSVLMTRMPMTQIEARLDVSAAAHPDRHTLADFRAERSLVNAETEALAAADRIITPHTEIAALFGDRAVRLDWHKPAPRDRTPPFRNRIAFPGPTIARKGAYELREAARALDFEVVLVGSDLEGADFWAGVRTRRTDPENWFDGVAAVVQPALLEDAPRGLLAALASGVPVIATPACGLPPQDGLTLAPADDTSALIEALRVSVASPRRAISASWSYSLPAHASWEGCVPPPHPACASGGDHASPGP
ncbi:MAG TPA: VanW family protein [Rhizomicrobium sp.]|nr:VanW family protein [Rhizomicrobium sp.]